MVAVLGPGMGPRAHLFGVLVLVVIAGCSGVTTGVNDRTITVTPAEVPGVTTQTEIAELTATSGAPSGFADPAGWAAVHAGVLANTSYAVVANQQFRFPDTNRTSRWQMRGRFGQGGRFIVEVEKNGTVFGTAAPTRTVYWSDGNRVLEALATNDSNGSDITTLARHNTTPLRRALPVDPRFELELARVFSLTTIADVTPVQRVGQNYERVRLKLTGPTEPARPPTARATLRVHNLTARLVIDGRGFVHRIHLRYEGAIFGEPVVIRRSIRYGAVGATTVRQPSWIQNENNESGSG